MGKHLARFRFKRERAPKHRLGMGSIRAGARLRVGCQPRIRPRSRSAVIGLLNNITNTDPESAFAWAASLETEGALQNWTSQAFENRVELDQSAALAAAESADIPVELRDRLLRRYEEPESPPSQDTSPDPFSQR